jgi:hypothetical protein
MVARSRRRFTRRFDAFPAAFTMFATSGEKRLAAVPGACENYAQQKVNAKVSDVSASSIGV